MATFTPVYNLEKPGDADFADNTPINANMDIIDGKLPRFIRKPSDESVTSSTTFQADNDFTFSVTSGKIYKFDLALRYTAATAGDLKIEWTHPGGAFVAVHVGLDDASTGATGSAALPAMIAASISTSPTATRVFGGSGATGCSLFVTGTYAPTSNGTVTLRWAQNASSGTATVINTGSYLMYWEF